MTVTNFYLGANSGDGFQNLFSRLADDEQMRDVMLLKGGPGSGKSTFIRQIGKFMEAAGTSVEYYRCAGDPDALDGLLLPELRCAVLDGTPPHVSVLISTACRMQGGQAVERQLVQISKQ